MQHRNVRAFVWILTLLAAAVPAAAQLSNSSIKGTYAFRYLGVTATPCDCPVSFVGTIAFDGAGGFTVGGLGNYVNSSGGASQTLTPAASGTYTVFSSGMFYMDNPFAANGIGSATNNTVLYGGVGQGAIVASSTESNNLDTFVALPVATSASNATLTGTYQVASLEFAGGNIANTRNTIFTMAADGKGGLGNVSIKGTSLQLNNTATTQVSNGATYSVTANGSGSITFPAPSGVSAANQLLSGTKTLYVSQDGNLFIAGTPTGYDLVIGIKAMAAPVPNPPVSGLYFFSELENYTIGGSASGIYAYYGASDELGDKAATELDHYRVNSDLSAPYDETTSFTYSFDSTGVDSEPSGGYTLAAGANGNMFLIAGNSGDYYVSLGVKLQPVTGSGVFLSPSGVVNAATFSPFTAQISPGELITLFGSGMAPAGTLATASAPFPNTLAGVGVTINGVPAPVYVVTPTQISALVPYTLDPTATFIANVQVTNNGTPSNTVTEYLGVTSPGVFTGTQNGLGNGAILHSDFSLVNSASPAKPGETILIYLTGLGAVKPAVTTGTPAPSNSLTSTVNTTAVYIDGLAANVLFSGLAPGFAGLYQLNVTVPAGVTKATAVTLEVDGLDAITLQATIPISN
jgi:uncharacterized protein (TIGR03437 family)